MITAFLSSLFARVQGWAVAALALIAAVGSAFLIGRSKGSKSAQTEARAEKAEANAAAMRETVAAAKERNNVDIEIAGMSDDDVSGELRQWMRDGQPDANKNH